MQGGSRRMAKGAAGTAAGRSRYRCMYTQRREAPRYGLVDSSSTEESSRARVSPG